MYELGAKTPIWEITVEFKNILTYTHTSMDI